MEGVRGGGFFIPAEQVRDDEIGADGPARAYIYAAELRKERGGWSKLSGSSGGLG